MGNASSGVDQQRSSAVHPHGRGERGDAVGFRAACAGSSPRAWGTHTHHTRHDITQRFIPTGVGNTRYRLSPAPQPPVHPHGRGEHGEIPTRGYHVGGSSPRAWGTRCRSLPFPLVRRFIPTGVGNTQWWSGCQSSVSGSSPRAWGTREISGRTARDIRFIPTGVGNTLTPRVMSCRGAVHPHGRGEHDAVLVQSPEFGRFIPTGVGNTGPQPGRSASPPVHPHGRGEHSCEQTMMALIMRFIPTGVGNTIAAPWGVNDNAVHPHGRGEHKSITRPD